MGTMDVLKRISAVFLSALLLSCGGGGGGGGADIPITPPPITPPPVTPPPVIPPTTAAKTTLMVYSVVSNLSSGTDDLLRELRSVGSSQDFNIIVQTGGGSGTYAQNSRFRVNAQGGFEPLPVNTGEIMTTSAALVNFIRSAVTLYPADKFHLIMVNHGGYGYYGQDDRDKARALFPRDIAVALNQVGVKLDLFGFDTCLLATSTVAQEMSGVAKVLLASEEIGWSGGSSSWDFAQFRGLKAVPDATVATAKALADSYIARNGTTQRLKKTVSVIDLTQAPTYFAKQEELLGRLTSLMTTDAAGNEIKKRVANARKRSYSFGSFLDKNFQYDVDVGQFLNELKVQNVGSATNALIDATLSEYKKIVLYSRNADTPMASGLSMVVPVFSSRSSISNTANFASTMVTGTATASFISRYGQIVGNFGAPVDAQETTQIVVSGTGGCVVGVTCKPGQEIESAKDGLITGSVADAVEVGTLDGYVQTPDGIILQSRDLPLTGTDFQYRFAGVTYRINGLDSYASISQPSADGVTEVRMPAYINGELYVILLVDTAPGAPSIVSITRLPTGEEKLISPQLTPEQVIGAGATLEVTRGQLNETTGLVEPGKTGSVIPITTLNIERVAPPGSVSGFVRVNSTSGDATRTRTLRLN